MWMIVGIGNHGNEYANTRHNCGFFVVDELAKQWGQEWQLNKKWKTDIIRHRPTPSPRADFDGDNDDQVVLLRPRTYVNATGAAMQAAATFFKIKPANILVIVDDIHLKLGDLRYRTQGGAGGHNGLRDIEARFGKGYPRLRMGIGSPSNSGQQQVQHVLGKFSPEESPDRDAMVSKAADACIAWLSTGDDGVLRFNGPLRPPASPPKKPTNTSIQNPAGKPDTTTTNSEPKY